MHESDRREIFFKIVCMQDEGVSVDDSRRRITTTHDLDEDKVREIEDEGLAKNWPPLSVSRSPKSTE